MDCGIYKITIGPNKFYYGSAVNLKKRKVNHLSALSNNKHRNDMLQIVGEQKKQRS